MKHANYKLLLISNTKITLAKLKALEGLTSLSNTPLDSYNKTKIEHVSMLVQILDKVINAYAMNKKGVNFEAYNETGYYVDEFYYTYEILESYSQYNFGCDIQALNRKLHCLIFDYDNKKGK